MTSGEQTSTSASEAPVETQNSGAKTGAIAGGVVGGVGGALAIAGIVGFLLYLRRKQHREKVASDGRLMDS